LASVGKIIFVPDWSMNNEHVWWGMDITPCVLNFAPIRRNPRYQFQRKLVCYQNRFWRFDEENNWHPCRIRNPDSPVAQSVICASFKMSRSTKYSISNRGTGGVISCGIIAYRKVNTVELHFSVLFGKASHLDMQKIRTIGFFKNRLHCSFEIEKNYTHNFLATYLFTYK
jgi:hypothetical protein